MHTQTQNGSGLHVHIGRASISRRDRGRCSRSQSIEVKKAIEKKILEGKFLAKIIYYELIQEGIITDDLNSEDKPILSHSTIAWYIKLVRESMGVNLPLTKYRILELHKRFSRLKLGKSQILSEIVKELGCSFQYVSDVLYKHGKITKRKYFRP